MDFRPLQEPPPDANPEAGGWKEAWLDEEGEAGHGEQVKLAKDQLFPGGA